jgi:hypothetical protein
VDARLEEVGEMEKVRIASYLTTLEFAKLNHALLPIAEAFGGHTYLVGSVQESREFRDVDVRTILDDEDFDARFKDELFWGIFCMGITTYLQNVTGLPLDYQVQRRTEANEKHSRENGGTFRNPIGTRARPFAGGGDATNFKG